MVHTQFQSVTILCTFIFLFILGSAVAQSPDASVMLQLKKNMIFITDKFWTDKDPCQWESVQCNNGNVISIQLGRMGIRGSLPLYINQLRSLQIFDVSHNHLSGPLPTFSGMSSLKTLLLNGNRFSEIPDDFFNWMESLEIVSLDMNPLEQWTIPASLADAAGLKSFSAVSTHIVGRIPGFFGLANLTSLHLSFNYLEGELPVEFSGSSIQSLWLDRQLSQSKLTGSIDVLSNMTSLVDVWLHYNNFEGVIPDVSGLTKLEDFCVRDNKLFGPVPQSLIGLPSLKIVNLTNNLLQGKMPKFLAKVEVDDAGNNRYCLNTPNADCDLNAKILWKIASHLKLPAKFTKNWVGNDVCNWNGITCDSTKKNVTVISFQSMNLTGTIPPEFANFTSLERLYLQNNNLNGTIPAILGVLPVLMFIDVSSNAIIGPLPIFNMPVVVNGLHTAPLPERPYSQKPPSKEEEPKPNESQRKKKKKRKKKKDRHC